MPNVTQTSRSAFGSVVEPRRVALKKLRAALGGKSAVIKEFRTRVDSLAGDVHNAACRSPHRR